MVPNYKLNIGIFSFSNFLSSLIRALAIEFTHFVRIAGKAPKERQELFGLIFIKQNNWRTATAVSEKKKYNQIVISILLLSLFLPLLHALRPSELLL